MTKNYKVFDESLIDDDPTDELEMLDLDAIEAYGTKDGSDGPEEEEVQNATIVSLRSDLESRSEMIRTLQQDIERLKGRWSELENELKERDTLEESLTYQLQAAIEKIELVEKLATDKEFIAERLKTETTELHQGQERLVQENANLKSSELDLAARVEKLEVQEANQRDALAAALLANDTATENLTRLERTAADAANKKNQLNEELEAVRKALGSTNNQLSAQLEKTVTERNSFESQLSESLSARQRLAEELAHTKTAQGQAVCELEGLRNSEASLHGEVERYSIELQESRQALKLLQTQLEDNSVGHSALRARLAAANERAAAAEQRLSDALREHELLHSARADSQEQVEALQFTISEATARETATNEELASLRTALEEQIAKSDQQRLGREQVEAEKHAAESDRDRLQEELQSTQRQLEQAIAENRGLEHLRDEHAAELDAAGKLAESHLTEIAEIRDEKVALVAETDQQRAQIADFEQRLQAAEVSNADLAAQAQAHVLSLSSYESDTAELTAALAEAQAAASVACAERDEQAKNAGELRATLNRIEGELAEARQHIEESTMREAEFADKLIDTERSADTLRKDLESLRDQYTEQEKQLERYAAENTEKTEAIAALESSQIATVESATALEQDIESLRAEIAERDQRLEHVTVEIAEKTTAIATLESSHDASVENAEALQRDIESLRKKIAARDEKLEKLTAEIAEKSETLATLNAKIDGSADRLSAMTFDLEALEKQNDEMRAELHAANEACERDSTLIADKEQTIVALREDLKRSEATIANMRGNVNRLKDIGASVRELDQQMSERMDDKRAIEESLQGMLVGNVLGEDIRIPLDKDRITIGRLSGNDIPISAAFVSRRHATVIREDEKILIQDEGSKNGVVVNGEKIQIRELENGDRITIGESVFTYLAAVDGDGDR